MSTMIPTAGPMLNSVSVVDFLSEQERVPVVYIYISKDIWVIPPCLYIYIFSCSMVLPVVGWMIYSHSCVPEHYLNMIYSGGRTAEPIAGERSSGAGGRDCRAGREAQDHHRIPDAYHPCSLGCTRPRRGLFSVY